MARDHLEPPALHDLVTEARLAEEVRRLEALIAAQREERLWQERSTEALLEALRVGWGSRGAAPARLEVNADGTPRRRKWYKADNSPVRSSSSSHVDLHDPNHRGGSPSASAAAPPREDSLARQQREQQGPQMVLDARIADEVRADAAPKSDESMKAMTDKKNAVTTKQLDLGDMYEANTSIWDASMFIFHPCLGPAVSIILILVWLLNLGTQVYFCYIVFMHMLEDDVRSETLTELLRFRLYIGHQAFFADQVSHRSLTAQVCMEDRKAFMAGLQMEKIDDVEEFLAGGTSLMIVAQGLWICTILKELNAAWSFARALLHLERGKSTRLILAESNDFDESHVVEVDSDDEVSTLATIMVVTRMTKVRQMRLWASIAFIFVPRLLLGLVLGYTGVRFLGKTARNEDLLLNAIALAFVSEIDELFFDIFVPRRVHALIHNLEALPMPHKKCRRTAGVHSVFKLGLVGGALFATWYFLLRPYFWMLNQAYDIVCSGEQNFVFAANPITNLVHVAKTAVEDEWTELEKIILQVAYPSIESRFSWDIESDIVAQSTANKTRAIFMTDNAFHSNNISKVDYRAASFQAVMQIDSWSPGEAAMAQSCADLAAGEVALEALRHLMQNSSLASCEDVPWQLCADLNMKQLRALCPRRCNCDRPPLISPGYAGFFRTPASGCPSQCASLTASYNEISYQTASTAVAFHPDSLHSCMDATTHRFIHDASQTCVDSDQFQIGVTGPAGNIEGSSCESYTLEWHDVGDGDWQQVIRYLNVMGELMPWPELGTTCPWWYDDSDFTASDLCCICGGGLQDLNISSVGCFQNLTDDCASMSPSALWFLLYVKGLFEHLGSDQFFEDTLRDSVYNPSQIIGTEFYQSEELVQSVMNGSLAESMLSGRWEFMYNSSHPRGLTGCDFLTSFEFKALLNMDLCDSTTFSSIKFLCPESCGCRPIMFWNEDRDYSRNEDITSSWSLDGPPWFIAPELLTFSNDRVALRECPASCAVPHRNLQGQDKGWDSFEDPFKKLDEHDEPPSEEGQQTDEGPGSEGLSPPSGPR